MLVLWLLRGDGDTMVRLKCKMDVTKNLNDLTGFNQDVEPKNKTLQQRYEIRSLNLSPAKIAVVQEGIENKRLFKEDLSAGCQEKKIK